MTNFSVKGIDYIYNDNLLFGRKIEILKLTILKALLNDFNNIDNNQNGFGKMCINTGMSL